MLTTQRPEDAPSRAPAVTSRSGDGVVVGYDGSAGSRRALGWAALEAGRRRAPLTVLHVVDVRGGIARDPGLLIRYAAAVGSPLAEDGTRRARAADGAPRHEDVHRAVRVGSPTSALLRASAQADLLVVGSHGRGSAGAALLGPVASGVSAQAACPVVVVHRDAQEAGGACAPVVVGVDGSRAAASAIPFAAAAAQRSGTRLVAVAAWAPRERSGTAHGGLDDERSAGIALESVRAGVATVAGGALSPDVEVRAVRGHADDVLVAAAAGARLVVVGARGRGVVRASLLGSVSQAVLHRAEGPVAVVRHAG